MNESFSPIPGDEPAALDYKDRSTGLLIFGILTLILGALCGLLVLLMVFGQLMAAQATQAPISSILPALSIYGVLAVALIWLGIGSIQARRWARALLLIFSWSWLVVGIITLTAMTFIMPKILGNIPSHASPSQPAVPHSGIVVVMILMCLFLGVFFVLVPAVWIFFYGSRHVKATCEARDPVTRWTDACPLPLLALCLWVMLGVPTLLLLPISGHFVMPFFGTFITGIPCALLCLGMAALWSYSAWLIYHLKPLGWWLILFAIVAGAASSMVTFGQHNMLEMYQLMGYPQAQIDQIQKTGLLMGNNMNWLMSFSMVPFLGYLLFVKKYFRTTS